MTLEGLILEGGGAAGPGVVVAAGVERLYIHRCEVAHWGDDGLRFLGAITGLKVFDNRIHDNGGDGIELAQAPGGVAQITGNSLRANAGLGINLAAGSLNAAYNEWGSIDGPTGAGGDGVSAGVTAEPWVFGKLWVEAPALAREAEPVTVQVRMDVHSLYGASFRLTFPADKLQLTALPTVGGFQTGTPGAAFRTGSLAAINASGVITFTGYRAAGDAEYDAVGDILLTLPFQALEIAGPSAAVALDFTPGSAQMAAQGGVNIILDAVSGGALTLLGTTTVSGVVDLQGRPNDAGATVSLPAGPLYPGAVQTTDLWGRYTLTDVTDGDYTPTIEMARYLDAAAAVTVGGDNQTLATVTLLGGDVNDSDHIDINDLSAIGGRFGEVVDPALAAEDINYDGEIDILDLVLAAGNYDLSSPVSWTP